MPKVAEPGTIEVTLPKGDVTVSTLWTPGAEPRAALALAHGSGGGMTNPLLGGVADALADAGVSVLRFTFPYREAGRRMPGPAAHAIATWQAAMAELASRAADPAGAAAGSGLPLFAAGKSYGGRMASVAVAEGRIAPAGLVYLGYPLHPPGEPEKPRAEHLMGIAVPQLFVEGTRDPFIQPVSQLEDAVASCSDASIVWIEGGAHSFEVAGTRRDPEVIGAELAASVLPWLRERTR